MHVSLITHGEHASPLEFKRQESLTVEQPHEFLSTSDYTHSFLNRHICCSALLLFRGLHAFDRAASCTCIDLRTRISQPDLDQNALDGNANTLI